MTTPYDIIIIGGGMVGASLARALSGSGLRIAVVEAWPADSARQPSYDDRAIALAWGTRLILDGMRVWPRLAAGAEVIRHIHVSDRGHFGFTRLHAHELQVEALGYVTTAHTMGQCLLRDLEAEPGIDLYCPATLESFSVEQRQARVRLAVDGQPLELEATLLVAADGGRSAIRRGLGIEVREWGYGQTAVISNLTPGIEADGTAYERFTDQGPMAMLPLTGGRYGLVWTLDDQQVDQVLELDDEAFLARVQGRFGQRLGRFQKAGKRASYPLKLLRTKEHVRPRVALIGNAAHALHPITGQGFNLGIRDVAVLAEVLSDAFRAGRDIGSMEVLDDYARWRRRDQQAVALMTDGLVRLFTNPLLPVRVARNLGLLALDLLPPAKRLLTRQFMGINGRLPRLSRGLPLDR